MTDRNFVQSSLKYFFFERPSPFSVIFYESKLIMWIISKKWKDFILTQRDCGKETNFTGTFRINQNNVWFFKAINNKVAFNYSEERDPRTPAASCFSRPVFMPQPTPFGCRRYSFCCPNPRPAAFFSFVHLITEFNWLRRGDRLRWLTGEQELKWQQLMRRAGTPGVWLCCCSNNDFSKQRAESSNDKEPFLRRSSHLHTWYGVARMQKTEP